MLKIKDNVPDVYVRKSRDFQLMCNVFDCMNMAVKFDIDSIDNLTNTSLCNENTLPLLQNNLGFFSNLNLTGKDLRTILKSFPYLVKNKGTITGIKQAIQLFLKVIDIDRATNIEIINNSTHRTALDYNITDILYVIDINIKDNILDTTILTEILKYIIPAGYAIRYHFYKDNILKNKIFAKDVINIIFIDRSHNGSVRYEESLDEMNSVNNVAMYRKIEQKQGDE